MSTRLRIFSANSHLFMWLTILCHLLENREINGQERDNAEFGLLEEVPTPTPITCDFKKRSVVKRSANVSSPQTNESSDASWADDCMTYRSSCPEKVKLSFLQAAPFVYSKGSKDNDTNNGSSCRSALNGIFVDILRRTFGTCCQLFSRVQPTICYHKQTTDLEGLQLDLLNGSADMIMPVHSDEEKYGGTFPYLKVLDSPGILLIERYSPVNQWQVAFKAALGTWPVVVTALLMCLVAGGIIWLLDKSTNKEQFSRTFHMGVIQGFWWAFVTMTTVGYGDKTPKSGKARLFAIVWMIIGITVCSVMTASLSSALTSARLQEDHIAAGKRIGVLFDSVAYLDAVDLATDVQTFEDPHKMYDALIQGERIDGILDEFFTGLESIKTKDTFRKLTIAKVIWNKRSFGVAYRNSFLKEYIANCTSTVIRAFSNDVLNVTNKYLHDTEESEGRKVTGISEPSTINIFVPLSTPFMACIVSLSIFALFCLVGGGISFLLKRKRRTGEITARIVDNSTLKERIKQENQGPRKTSRHREDKQQTQPTFDNKSGNQTQDTLVGDVSVAICASEGEISTSTHLNTEERNEVSEI